MEKENLFKEAQRLTRWHYQWVVVHDFVRRVAGQDVVDDILRQESFVAGGSASRLVRARLLFYKPRRAAFMPVEFAVAAYRFGHSMIRGRYHINDVVRDARGDDGPIPIFSDVQAGGRRAAEPQRLPPAASVLGDRLAVLLRDARRRRADCSRAS